MQHDPAVVTAEAAPADPGDLAERPELVEQARLVAGDAGREDVALQHGGGDRHARELVHDLGEALQRRVPRSGAASDATGSTPCHAGRKRPSASGSTGSTSRRSRASERRRSIRSTSGSHHSRSEPDGRNSPRTIVPAARAARAHPRRPRAAGPSAPPARARNGPWERAQRASSPSSAPVTASRNASGTPRRRRCPTPSRYRPTSSIATQRSSPAMRIAHGAPGGGELAEPASARGAARDARRDLAGRQVADPPQQVVEVLDGCWPGAPRSGTGATARGRRAPRDRAARAAPPGRAARAAGPDRARARRRGARPAARRPRTCTPRRSRTGATRQTARPCRLDAVDRDLPPLDAAEDLAQRVEVEHVGQALAVGLDEDREATVARRDLEQVGRALALLPQRRPRARAGGAAAGAPAPRSRGSARRTAPSRRPPRRPGPRPRPRPGRAAPRSRRAGARRRRPRPRAAGPRCRRPTRSSGPRSRAARAAASRSPGSAAHGPAPPNGDRITSRQSPSSSRKRSTTRRRSVGRAPATSRSSSR